MHLSRLSTFSFLLAGAVTVAACTTSHDGAAAGAEAVTGGGCRVFSARLGRVMTDDELAAQTDPIGKELAATCPQSFADFSKTEQAKGCTLSSHLVSEVAADTGAAASRYRAAVAVDCPGGTNHDLFFSLFGISAKSLPSGPNDTLETIGFDPTNGVFNYYVHERGEGGTPQWKLAGSSADGFTQGYDCDARGACEPKQAAKARCFACHESGGLNMKELHSPWTGWDDNERLPGADDIYARFGTTLGKRDDAPDLESRVEAGNGALAKARVKQLRQLGARELLRPLFCTLTVNLKASGVGGGLPMSFAFSSAIIDGASGDEDAAAGANLGPVSLDVGQGSAIPSQDMTAIYTDVITTHEQGIFDDEGPVMKGSAPVLDTSDMFLAAEKGNVDKRYLGELVDEGIVDSKLVKDVLAVDFTRALFSPTRCALLDAVPADLEGDAVTPSAIAAAMKQRLASSTGAGRELLARMNDSGSAAKDDGAAKAFVNACAARGKADPRAFTEDLVHFEAYYRSSLKLHQADTPDGRLGIIEFPETLPRNDFLDESSGNAMARFAPVFYDPTTCALTAAK